MDNCLDNNTTDKSNELNDINIEVRRRNRYKKNLKVNNSSETKARNIINNIKKNIILNSI